MILLQRISTIKKCKTIIQWISAHKTNKEWLWNPACQIDNNLLDDIIIKIKDRIKELKK